MRPKNHKYYWQGRRATLERIEVLLARIKVKIKSGSMPRECIPMFKELRKFVREEYDFIEEQIEKTLDK